MVWPAAERKQAQEIIKSRQHNISELNTIVLELKRENFTKEFWDLLSLDMIEIADLAAQTATIAEIAKELGIQGEVYTKVTNGKTYLIIKGYAGKRATITGTRYLITNPKVANIAVTPKQLVKGALKSTIICVIAYTAWNAIDAIFNTEDAQLAAFLGTTFSDSLKFAAGAGIGALCGMAAASAAGVAVLATGPVIIAVLASVAVGAALDHLDDKYGITERLIAAIDKKLDELYDNAMRGPREFNRQWNQWERYLNDAALDGTLNHALRRMFGG